MWRVLEGELRDQGSVTSLWPVVLELLAPRTEFQTFKGGVVLLTLGNHLLETAWAELRHLCRGKLRQLARQSLNADSRRHCQTLWVPGRVIAHHMRDK